MMRAMLEPFSSHRSRASLTLPLATRARMRSTNARGSTLARWVDHRRSKNTPTPTIDAAKMAHMSGPPCLNSSARSMAPARASWGAGGGGSKRGGSGGGRGGGHRAGIPMEPGKDFRGGGLTALAAADTQPLHDSAGPEGVGTGV